MQWSDDVKVETPEQIDVSLEVAGLGSRFVAWIVDVLLLAGIYVGLGVIVAVILALLGADLSEDIAAPTLVGLAAAAMFLVEQCYDIYFELQHNGQTPGKRIAGIRVLREGGAPVDFRTSAIRNLLRVADFLPAVYLLGGFLVLIGSRNQRLGDLAAGTLVTRERSGAPPADLHAVIDRFAARDIVFTAEQLAGCSPQDRHVLRSFFQRWEEMEDRPRRQLARKLADEYLRKTSYNRGEDKTLKWSEEAFLASLFRDLKALDQHER